MILKDYAHEGSTPPYTPLQIQNIPPTFANATAYADCMLPLLMVECWQQLCSSREVTNKARQTDIIDCTIAGRQTIDDFTDFVLDVTKGVLPERMYFNESDLVILRQDSRVLIAKVQNCTNRKSKEISLSVRSHLASDRSGLSAVLVPRSRWQVLKLMK